MRIVFILLFVSVIQSVGMGQIFTKDTTRLNGGKSKEIIVNENQRFFCSDNSISKFVNGTFCCGYGVINNSAQCLHDNSRYRDMEVLSNGSFTGLFYHSESCVPNESVFIMLDSTGNVLVDKRFAEGLSLFQGGIIEQDSMAHVYAMHLLPGLPKDGLVHYTFDYQGNLIDSVSRLTELWYGGYAGFPGFTVFGDSLLIPASKSLGGTASAHELVMTDFELSENHRTIFSDSLNGIDSWKVYNDTAVLVLYRGNYLGYRAGIARVAIDGTGAITDTCTLGSSVEYSDVIRMGNYYVVTEYNHLPNSPYKMLVIYDLDLNIIKKEQVTHDLNYSKFIKTSDSTFVIYDETWTHEYTMNFDSIPGYVNSISNLFSNNSSELEVQAFPNPTSNSIKIQYQISQEVEVSLFTISGVELERKQSFNTHETNFDLSAYPKGLYMLQVKTDQGKSVVKVIRE